MVDAIGGVQVCIPEDIDDPAHAIHIEAGTRKLQGKQALNYVRERYVVGDGSDVGRMKRQQAFSSPRWPTRWSRPARWHAPTGLLRFLDSATKSLTVDPGLKNVVKLAQLGDQFKGIGLDHIQFITDPVGVRPADPQPASCLAEPAGASDVWDRIAERRAAHQAPSDAATPSRAGDLPGPPSRPRAARPSPVRDGPHEVADRRRRATRPRPSEAARRRALHMTDAGRASTAETRLGAAQAPSGRGVRRRAARDDHATSATPGRRHRRCRARDEWLPRRRCRRTTASCMTAEGQTAAARGRAGRGSPRAAAMSAGVPGSSLGKNFSLAFVYGITTKK